ncbi:hypothetical protein J2X31_001345 [Flavobacterium arsenatis]|uniref:Secretion system C-terminal sorting domain-containing protein n=1 Tax=Flavobacterium arsenatis TaxID=1484332 RepID=A0ABU1TN78_9FLAO|nr:T9SS type A sorting domain-containing protein [Flavobacterium arsenatis]MDR6967338.1 hypothetical protein [Flavobacterium arsenatis]
MKKLYFFISAGLLLNSLDLIAQTDFLLLDGFGSRLYDINDNGNAVHPGAYYSYSTNTSSPAEAESTGTNRLNNAENVAGKMLFVAGDGSNLDQGAYKKNGVWTAIGYFPGDVPGNSWFGNAYHISENSTYVAGQMTSDGPGSSYPFIYNTDTNTLTKLIGDGLWNNGRGSAVNDNGVVAGWVDREDIFNTGTFRVPAYFDAGGAMHYIDFDVPEYGEANDVNNAGQVVGYKGSKAFIYNTSTQEYQAFDAPVGQINPVFVSISDNGVAVGYCGMLGDRDVIIYHPSIGENPVLLTDFLATQEVDVTTSDGKLGTALGVSPDGTFICGFDNAAPVFFAAGWVVRLDESLLSLKEVKKSKLQVSMYPNPVKDVFTISSEENIESLQIYSVSGQLLISKLSIKDKSFSVDLSDLQTGMYIAIATLDDMQTQTVRVIKE